VTHDQIEALSMSNQIAVMAHGKIVQEGTPREIYQHPTTQFVADFVGSANFLEAEILGPGVGGAMRLATPAGTVEAACPVGVGAGEKVTLSIRPENIRVHLTEPSRAANVLPGVVEELVFLGEYLDCRIRLGTALLFTRQHPTIRTRQGDNVFVELPVELCAVLTDRHGVSSASYLGAEAEDEGQESIATT
jgi:iron(III) transport system ATP-binding protein